MSYVLVKRKTTALARDEISVASSTWIKQDGIGTPYVFFPKAVCTQKINALLKNHTKPTAEWEKHKCVIVCNNIPSLSEAYSIVETMLKLNKVPEGASSAPNKRTNILQQDTDNDCDPFADIPFLPAVEDDPVCLGAVEDHQVTVKECDSADPMQQLFDSFRLKQKEQGERDRDMNSEPEGSHSSSGFEQKQSVENVETFFSSLNKSMRKPDSIVGDELPTSLSQLFDILLELKSTMQSNHAQLRRDINEGFCRLQKTVLSAIGKDAPGNSAKESPAAFEMKPVTCTKELYELEIRLREDPAFRAKVYRWIDATVLNEAIPERRMSAVLDKVMDRKYFTQLEGSSQPSEQKNVMAKYKHFCKLFVYAGTIRGHRADDRIVQRFLMNKQELAQAGFSRTGNCQCEAVKSSIKKSRNESETKDDGKPKNGANMNIGSPTPPINREENVSEIIELDSDEEKGTTSNKTQSSGAVVETASSEVDYVEINPITSFEGMEEFDRKLADRKYRATVHSWIDSTVQRMVVPNERMNTILDKLVDRELLKKFDWGGIAYGKRAIKSYTNFICLFQYVGTIVPWHQANLRQVQLFFSNKFVLLHALDS